MVDKHESPCDTMKNHLVNHMRGLRAFAWGVGLGVPIGVTVILAGLGMFWGRIDANASVIKSHGTKLTEHGAEILNIKEHVDSHENETKGYKERMAAMEQQVAGMNALLVEVRADIKQMLREGR